MNVCDLYTLLARAPINYRVKIGALSQVDFDDVATIEEGRVDNNKKEVVFYANTTLVQVSPEREQARERVLRECELLTEVNAQLNNMINTLIAERKNLCDIIAAKDLEISRRGDCIKSYKLGMPF